MKASTKVKSGKLAARILAWVLAILMVVSLAYFSAVMIVDNIRAAQKENSANTETSTDEKEDGHDHDGDGVADH